MMPVTMDSLAAGGDEDDDDDDDDGGGGGGGGGGGDTGGADGDTLDPGEDVTYLLTDLDADGNQELVRTTAEGNQIIAEHIESLAFTYQLADGTVTTHPTGGDLDDIRLIEITLVAKTAKPDPAYPNNGGYRIYKLHQAVRIRNL